MQVFDGSASHTRRSKRGVQLRGNCISVISNDDQLDIDPLVWHRNTSGHHPVPARFQGRPSSRVMGYSEVEPQLARTANALIERGDRSDAANRRPTSHYVLCLPFRPTKLVCRI
jgi:hypothetical protein